MTTWTSISNAAVAVGGIPASTTVTALRDNPSALAESASGAPVMVSGWHPHDKVTIGDGKTGLIYDFAVNGVQTSIVTPNFVDGYEYRIVAHGLSHNSVSNNGINISFYLETDARLDQVEQIGDNTSSALFGFDMEVLLPRIPKTNHIARISSYAGSDVSGTNTIGTYDATVQKVLYASIRFRTSGGSFGAGIDAGKVWMFRRREYASSP
jgi:hypothetical protein